MSQNNTSNNNTALAAAKATADNLKDAAERAKTLAKEADRLDCDAWAAYGGSHDRINHPSGGQAPKVVELKARAAALAAAAEKAQEAYEDLLARAS